MTPIIDIHQHAPAPGDIAARVAACRANDIVKAVLLGLPESFEPGDNDHTLTAWRAEPDLFIPFYGVDMDRDTADDIDRARAAGFAGLKFIGPARPYNDPAYLPFYARAQALGLPTLFHLGIVANVGQWRRCDSNCMRPIHLDHIARTHPDLTVIGAHFGNPWSDEAAMACRWNPNLFFDFSGSLLKYRRPDFLANLLWWQPDGPYAAPDKTAAWQKILFGSDVADAMIADVAHDYTVVLETLNLPEAWRTDIWYGTAAKILNLA